MKAFNFLFLCSFIIVSCKKFIDTDPPTDQLTTVSVFSNDQSANAAMAGVYSEITKFNNYIGHGAMSVYPGLSADEITRNFINPGEDAYTNNAIPVNSFALLNNIWQKGYYHIYQSNLILENLALSNKISTELKNQLTGEAKFMRAFFHFYLVNLFGPIPLVTTSDYRINATLSRSDTDLVYQQIISDLTDAQNLLTSNYPTTERVRINKWAATALLARVYLYHKEWVHAESQASLVINSGMYQLTNLNNIFLPNSSEAILQFIPAISQIWNSSEGFSFLPSSNTVKPSYKLTSFLLNAFSANDQRKALWINSNTVGGVLYYYPYKYKTKSVAAGAPKTEYNMVLRLAEQYLIRAEARAQQNMIAGAQSDLDTIRQRAGLATTTANDKASMLQAIENERQVELFCEWGHRWFDLKRTGRINIVLGVEKASNWQSTDILYPIPQNEILKNPALTQNPGY